MCGQTRAQMQAVGHQPLAFFMNGAARHDDDLTPFAHHAGIRQAGLRGQAVQYGLDDAWQPGRSQIAAGQAQHLGASQ